ncbi:type VI secretion system protein IglI family protein [Aliikangiella coralliicola]|uniref:ImpA N-terminal domain-containing protein n=1 Tax=Aliikangiella coralliicola TaxID=2592383 RepID=A0A545UGG7_9GAMM|nr:type VI secretion system protein IglI family protein [Aliikangiella coralliicola]TQV88493.1 hypothetical protein FLL46_08185 [Aliikangiella coralliicola]
MSHSGLVCLQGLVERDPGIAEEYVEQAFLSMGSQWQVGNYDLIIERAEALFSQKVFDIRIVTYYLYSCWVVSPRAQLHQILNSLNTLLEQDCDVWLPLNITSRNCESKGTSDILLQCLKLLLKKVEQRIGQHSNEQEAFKSSCGLIVAEMNKLAAHLSNHFQLSELVYKIHEIRKNHFDELIEYDPESQSAENESQELNCEEHLIESDSKNESTEKGTAQNCITRELNQNHAASQLECHSRLELYCSHPLKKLIRKIELFDELISQKDLFKASIVNDDIQQEIDNFNPLHYLPSIFKRFAELRVVNEPLLSQHLAVRDTSYGQALREYYAVDMEGFFNLELEEVNNSSASENNQDNCHPFSPASGSKLHYVTESDGNLNHYQGNHGQHDFEYAPEAVEFDNE